MVKYLGFYIPGLGLILGILCIIFIGFIVTRYFGRKIQEAVEKTLSTLPFFKQVYPAIKEIADFSKQIRGRGPSIHICGKTEKIWDDLVETGISRLSLDEVIDLAEAKDKIGHRISIAGNVSPTEILLNGNPQMIIEAARDCVMKAGNSKKGFTLSSGCTVATYTPIENIKALIEGAKT